MRLVPAWKNALALFYPSSFKLFILITIQSIIEAYKIIIHYWWWLLVLTGGTLFWWNNTKFFFFLFATLYYLLIFAFSLATRPSVARKNIAYFRSYFILFFPTMAGFLSIKLLGALLIEIIGIKMGQRQSIYLLIKSFSYATQVFFIFFFLDSDHTGEQLLQSLLRSVKMTIYNYPVCLIFGVIILGLEMAFSFFVGSFLFAWGQVGLLLRIISLVNIFMFVPIQLSIFANVYIKKLHEQYDYYF